MIIRNWREITPWLLPEFHGEGVDWRILSKIGTKEDAACLKTISFVSFARLQPGGAYRAHINTSDGQQSEENYCFIKGCGTIRIGDNDIWKVRDGDICFTPGGQVHHLINDGKEWIDFLAWSADVVEEEIQRGVVKNWRDCQPTSWDGEGLRWRMLSKIGSESKHGSVPCQRELSYADYCWLQGESSCEPLVLKGEEAVYFIISGTGIMRIGKEKESIRNGDTIYIPPDTECQLVNNQEGPIELISFGADV